MTDLPGRPVTPLQAPPGAFPAVLVRARHRRTRTAFVSAMASLAIIGGSVGTALAVSGGGHDRASVYTTTPPSPAAPTETDSASVTVSAPPDDQLTTFSGRVVDVDGNPIAGLHISRFSSTVDGRFSGIPEEHDDLTDAEGRFTTVCNVKILISTWMLGDQQHLSSNPGNYAAFWYGPNQTYATAAKTPCDPVGTVVAHDDLVMHPGATLTGTYPGSADKAGLQCTSLGLVKISCATFELSNGRYTFTGLPTGTVTITNDTAFTYSFDVTEDRTTTGNIS